MDVGHWALSACEAAWRCVSFVYEAVRALGTVGCMLAVGAGLQMGYRGLRLTEQESAPLAPARRSRVVGRLLQLCGIVLCAFASVALARHMVR